MSTTPDDGSIEHGTPESGDGPVVQITAEAAEAKMKIERVHEGVLHYYERLLLWWFAARMPRWVTADKLTFAGLAASFGVGLSYILAWKCSWWWIASIGFLVMHWFCDSMDGTIARFRDMCRPHYGQFVDIFVDNLSMFLWFVPLGYSPAIQDPRVGYMMVIMFYLTVCKVAYQDMYEAKHVISVGALSGTEGRIGLAVLALVMFFFYDPVTNSPALVWLTWTIVSLITLGLLVAAVVSSSMLAWRLRCRDEAALAARKSGHQVP
ncbi:CDP-alcohol phosphatidyltransferase [Pelomyxa schiedti]|nr:CDP-alcohol phosphatidyltransferase [Pelomyxa schiedti]